MALERLRAGVPSFFYRRVSDNPGWHLLLDPLSNHTLCRRKKDGRQIELEWVASHDWDTVQNESIRILKKFIDTRYRLRN